MKKLALLAFSVLLLVPVGAQNAFASPEHFIVSDQSGNKLQRVTPGGTVSTIANLPPGGVGEVSIDSNGDYIIIVSNPASLSTLVRVTPGGTVSTIAIGPSLGAPTGLAIDTIGDFIVADTTGDLLRVTPGGTVSTIVTLTAPRSVEVDSGGDYIVIDQPDKILRVTPGGTVSTIASGFSLGSPSSLAIDSGGDFIVTDAIGNLLRVTPGGTISNIASTGLVQPLGVAVDSGGDFIVTDASPGDLLRVTSGGTVSTIASGFGVPIGVAVEPQLLVGGEIIPISATSLLVSGIQTNLSWIVTAVIVAAGASAFLVKRKIE